MQLGITHWVVPFSFAVSTAIGTVSESELTESSAIAFLNQPWETLFIQAPSLISLLGQLTVMSGQVDFSLAVSPPVQGFRHVNFPNSFRATLSQVGHDAWNAFHAAHRNMDAMHSAAHADDASQDSHGDTDVRPAVPGLVWLVLIK